MNCWPNLLIQSARIKAHNSWFCSWFRFWFLVWWKMDFLGRFGLLLQKIQDFLAPGRFLVNLVSFVPYITWSLPTRILPLGVHYICIVFCKYSWRWYKNLWTSQHQAGLGPKWLQTQGSWEWEQSTTPNQSSKNQHSKQTIQMCLNRHTSR